MARKITIIDDDVHLREALVEQFALHDEFRTSGAASAAAGIAMVRSELPDLVLLDGDLPDMDGPEACKMLRRNGYKGPIIMLTAQASDADAILGLDSGANDYVAKPFRFAVLLARIRAHLRQYEQRDDAVLLIGSSVFRPSAKLLIRDDNRTIKLTEKEAAILKFLFRAGGAVVSRETLLQDVWGYHAEVSTHTLETHMYRLRQKIERDPAHAEILITEAGGYKLVP